MLVKKLNSNAVIPTQASPGDAGLDLVATSRCFTEEGYWEYGTSLAVKLPTGFFGMLCARSSISKKDLMLCNGFGVIDENYTGELKLRFKEIGTGDKIYHIGDKIAQLVIVPYVQAKLLEVQELPKTVRGQNGFGSSGT